MAYCENCGAFVKDGAKFCGSCGAKMEIKQAVNQDTRSQRKTTYDGEIHKCPNCGAVLNSFVKNCTECGYELRGATSTMSITDFSRAYSNAKNNSQKIDLIRTFAIPNTKEDILEFVIMASSNINAESYARETVIVSGGVSQQDLSEAWMSKFEQAYRKAEIVLQGDPYLDKIAKIYQDKKDSLSGAKKEAKKNAWRKKDKTLLWCALGFVFIFAMIGSMSIPHTIKEHKLEKQVEIIEELIDAGDYDAALRKADQLYDDTGWSHKSEEKWNEIRESYITRIEELQGKANGKVKIPTTDIDGKQFSDVETLYKNAGFINVTTEKVADLITGWLHDEGEVIEVVIGGSTTYETGSYVEKDVEVVIKYHGYSE